MAIIDERVTRLEERLSAIREDLQEVRLYGADNRKRIHDLEGDRAAVKALADTIRQMPQTMQGLAREAAATALVEYHRDRRQGFSTRAQVAAAVFAAVVTVCTLTTTILTVFHTGGHP